MNEFIGGMIFGIGITSLVYDIIIFYIKKK